MSRVWLCFLLLSALLVATTAQADDLAYSDVDRATVRVLAMGSVDIHEVEHEDVKYPVAVPIAGHGSGVMISSDGLILTAEHVIEDARSIAVLIPGMNRALPAVVIQEDEDHDYALIRVLGSFTQVASLADAGEPLAVRQTVFAIGYPLDARRTDPQSTQGIVSGVLPSGELQLGMTVNPGNSGGPVIDQSGKIRGIVVARSRLDQGAVGLAYAVPNSTFSAAVLQHQNTPLSAENDAKLRGDAAQLSAELTTLLSQYGLDVLKASLSAGKLDLDPVLRRTLSKASSGKRKSADGLLLSAAMYWNQSLVLKARGNTTWRKAREVSIKLARQAAELEPRITKDSKFVRLALSKRAGENTFGSFGSAPSSGDNMDDTSMDVVGAAGDDAPSGETGRRKKRRGQGFLGASVGYLSYEQHVEASTVTGTVLGVKAGYRQDVGASSWLLGGRLGFGSGAEIEVCGPSDGPGACRSTDGDAALIGLFGGGRFANILYVGLLIDQFLVEESSGTFFGVEAGLIGDVGSFSIELMVGAAVGQLEESGTIETISLGASYRL